MPRSMYIVLHIHRAGGTTLFRNFQANFRDRMLPVYTVPGLQKGTGWVSPEQIRHINDYVVGHVTDRVECLFGHMVYYGIHELLGDGVAPRYVTFLRDPIERVISGYYYIKNNSASIWNQELLATGWSLEAWLEHSTVFRMTRNGQLRELLLGSSDEALTSRDLTRDHLEEGKRRLARFWYVGLMDHFHEDSHYLYGKLGFWRFYHQAALNVARGKEEVPARTRELVAGHNALDMELYQFAGELRAAFVRANAADFQAQVRKAQIRRTVYTALTAPLRAIRRRG